jgi:hypothetical protein
MMKEWDKDTAYEIDKGKEERVWRVKVQRKLFSVKFQWNFPLISNIIVKFAEC